MSPGLVPLGFRTADVHDELRRRTEAHRGQLEAARMRLEHLQRQNADGRRQLAALEQELEQVRAEQQRLVGEPADNTPASTGPDSYQQALEALRRQVQAARSLRREIAATVFTIISPFLTARPASRPTSPSKEEPPHG